MKSFQVCFVVLFILLGQCRGILHADHESLGFKIEGKTIFVPQGEKELNVNVRLEKGTDGTLILYAFKKASFLDSSIDSIFFNDIVNSGGAGTVLVLLDENGSRREMHIDVCFDCPGKSVIDEHYPLSLSRVQELGKETYVNGAVYLKGRSRQTTNLKIPLTDVSLDKGKYTFYLIYYSGKELYDVVDRASVESDERRLNGKVMTGWIKSDIAQLIVN